MINRFDPVIFYPKYLPYRMGNNSIEEAERIWIKNYNKKDYDVFTYPAESVIERSDKLESEVMPELLPTAKDITNPEPFL